MPGKGSFVSLSEEAVKQRAAELKEKLTGVVQELKALGVPEAELIRIVRGGKSSSRALMGSARWTRWT